MVKKVDLNSLDFSNVVTISEFLEKELVAPVIEVDIIHKIPEQKRDIFESKRKLCYDKI